MHTLFTILPWAIAIKMYLSVSCSHPQPIFRRSGESAAHVVNLGGTPPPPPPTHTHLRPPDRGCEPSSISAEVVKTHHIHIGQVQYQIL